MHFKLNVYSVVLSFGVFQSWNILAHLLPVVFTCSQAAKTASMVFGQAHSLVHSFMSCNVFSTCHVFIGSLSSYQFCSLIGWCSLSCYSILFSSSCFVILLLDLIHAQACASEFSNFFSEFSAVTTDHIFIDTFWELFTLP